MPFSYKEKNKKRRKASNMNTSVPEQIAVLGAGSWGTAVALALAHQGHDVLLWARDPKHAAELQTQRCNQKYLGQIQFPKNLHVTSSLNSALLYPNVLIAVPSHAFLELLQQIPTLPRRGIAWLSKGLEPKSHRLFSEIIEEKYGPTPMAIISGPSFAKEVAQQKPTALVVAGNQSVWNLHWQKLLHSSINRVYLSSDLLGVQLCGAIKNVLAIACGISDGLEYGANARAALITRGIAEMLSLGLAMGAETSTFYGLSGLGDLVLTCTDNQSRNRRFGVLIGKNYTIDQACQEIQQVVEGLHNAQQVAQLAQDYQVDMPITQAVHQILSGTLSPQEASQQLLTRPSPLGA
jgi:glycerol-3-phosphate dehydrogenase (NAD(P)+)